MRIFLARHGETEWNVEHRLQGRSDTRLTSRGRAHAQGLAELMAHTALDAIYTSTLGRTIETAQPLAVSTGLVPEPRAELVELSYGVLEGRTAEDSDPVVQALWAKRKQDPFRFQAPGGESYFDLHRRVAPFVARLRDRHPDGSVLVVGHRGTNRVLRAILLGQPLEQCFAFKQKHDRVLEIRSGAVPASVEHRYDTTVQPGSES